MRKDLNIRESNKESSKTRENTINEQIPEDKLISAEELIKKAQELGINFGKGEPYNRLRYYTKMGWIPHMQRKGRDVKGHYPWWVINRLRYIEELRKKGLSKEKITEEVIKIEKLENIKNKYLTKKNKKIALIILGAFILLVLTINEIGIIKIGKNRNDLMPLGKPESFIFP
ncbi:MAG TPA: MerR family transcriptional regulator [bacterium]|nr:MerR family transcriptional regulator [bacterium]